MLKHPRLTFDRAKQFLDHDVVPRIVFDSVPVAAEIDLGSGYQTVEPGFKWGPAYAFATYRVDVRVPKGWGGREVGLCHGEPRAWGTTDIGIEATAFADGRAVGGLDFAHPFLRLSDRAEPGARHRLELRTYARNAQVTVHGREKPRDPLPEEFRGFFLAAVDPEMAQLAYDAAFALSLAEALGLEDPVGAGLLRALNDACNQFRPERPRSVGQCRRTLRAAIESDEARLAHRVSALGHAHLDTAWLWPLSVTRLKMAHTTAVQLGMADRYPEHVYVHSQASQYEWLEEEHPDLFDRVRKAVRRGQWEPLGSMWVEADCNLSGGEALVRQFLYGKRYFQERFGVDTVDMWLPDVFGYSAALPQILRGFGIEAFLTQKLSWNQFNKIPHHTFWWQGIDGTRVWTHFPPADTYTGDGSPKQILAGVRSFKDHGRSGSSMYLFGFGDGGGGPTEGQVESVRRARSAPGMPRVSQRERAAEFFRRAIAESGDLCTWVGELYFELHRGTYTSQAANKAKNRSCEMLLRDAELLASFAFGLGPDYPAEALERAWKLVLLNQFHDIVPGSSVREVYDDSLADYARVEVEAGAVLSAALSRLAAPLGPESGPGLAVFHNSQIPGEARVAWDGAAAPRSFQCGFERTAVQHVEDADGPALVFATPEAALGSVAVGTFSDAAPSFVPRLKSSPRRIENDEWVVRFDGQGQITSVSSLDDDPIEFIAAGELANVFQVFDDKPLFWDAWDVDAYALETGRPVLRSESFELVERGPVRVAVETVKRLGDSTIRQRISLGPTPGIRFDTWVDWHESEKMLKVAFPLRVNAAAATCEIQFGHVERPTHRNTSWDVARFEVCAQKWADMSEGGHGVALINDGKYGHDFLGSTMRLTLLRSPKAPDPECDMGRHRFTYVLLPHYGRLQHSDVVAASYALNAPVRTVPVECRGEGAASLPRLVWASDRSLVVESVKRSEDGGALIVRLYECHNTRGTAAVSCAMPVSRAFRADLRERLGEELEVVDGSVRVTFRPFEIVTLALVP